MGRASVACAVHHLGGVGPAGVVAVQVGDLPLLAVDHGIANQRAIGVDLDHLTAGQRCADRAGDQTACTAIGGEPVVVACDAARVFGHAAKRDRLLWRLRDVGHADGVVGVGAVGVDVARLVRKLAAGHRDGGGAGAAVGCEGGGVDLARATEVRQSTARDGDITHHKVGGVIAQCEGDGVGLPRRQSARAGAHQRDGGHCRVDDQGLHVSTQIAIGGRGHLGAFVHDGRANGVVAVGQCGAGLVERPVGAVHDSDATLIEDHCAAAVQDFHQDILRAAIELRWQSAFVGERVVAGGEVIGAAACIAGAGGAVDNGDDLDGVDDVDHHRHINQHLRLGGAVVVDLEGVQANLHLPHVAPVARQTGVAQHTRRIADAVIGQCLQLEGVGVQALHHHLHFAGTAGGACGVNGAIRHLLRGGEGVRRHGGRIRPTQAEHVVRGHGQRGAALQLEGFDFLDFLHCLVGAERLQVERGVCSELEGVDACAAIDEACRRQVGLQAGRCDGDGVVPSHSTDCVSRRVGDGVGCCICT